MGIIPSTMKCEDCNRSMQWKWNCNNGVLGWYCYNYNHKGSRQQRASALKNSTFFRNANIFKGKTTNPFPRHIGKWLANVFHSKAQRTQQETLKKTYISQKLYHTWEDAINYVISYVRDKETISLGGESPVEFDGLYYKLKKQRPGGNNSRYNKQVCVFILINRYFNIYGRHNRLSFIVDEESRKCCAPIIIAHVPPGICYIVPIMCAQ